MPASWRYMMIVLVACLIASMVIARWSSSDRSMHRLRGEMATVETVTGPIDASELGTTLIHEHLRTQDEAVHAQWPSAGAAGGIPEREARRRRGATTPRSRLRDGGGRARREDDLRPDARCSSAATSGSCAASPSRPASRWSPCTGIYTYDHLPAVLRQPRPRADRRHVRRATSRRGSRAPRSRPRSSSAPPTSRASPRTSRRSTARRPGASVRTGAPIMAHSRPASDTAPRQIEIFEEEGVDLSQVQIAH